MKKIFKYLPLLLLTILIACKGQKEAVSVVPADQAIPADKMVAKEAVKAKDSMDKGVEKAVDSAKEVLKSAVALESPKLEKSLLWEITGNDLKEPSYLYGTIHLIDEKDFFWPTNAKASFDKSSQIVFEIDLDDMFDMGNVMGMMSKAFMKDGMTLEKLLSEEDYKIVNKHFENMGLPMFMLEKLKPMFLTVFAEGDIQPGGMEDSGMKSYEMEFYELAQAAEMSVGGLESMDDQISLFDSIPYDVQAEMLVGSIKSSSGESNEMEELVQIYKDQDIDKMVQAVESEDSEFSGYEDLFLNNRNKNWIPLMKDYMKEGVTFFAVGAGHLAGAEGVINLLMQEGYKLKPISQASNGNGE